jgi:hypothetical protein
MIAGIITYLASPFALGAFADSVRSDTQGLLIALAMPAGIGGSVAYFGMTMTDRHPNPWEWGLGLPSKCFWWGMAPYLLVGAVSVFFLPMAVLCSVIGWVMTILGGGITAFIIDRWFYKEE